MNFELFAAFLLITLILVLTPGPIVTLVIATGATQGIRAALVTVAGTTIGNALLITCRQSLALVQMPEGRPVRLPEDWKVKYAHLTKEK